MIGAILGLIVLGMAALVVQVWNAPLREEDASDAFEPVVHCTTHDEGCRCLHLVDDEGGAA